MKNFKKGASNLIGKLKDNPSWRYKRSPKPVLNSEGGWDRVKPFELPSK